MSSLVLSDMIIPWEHHSTAAPMPAVVRVGRGDRGSGAMPRSTQALRYPRWGDLMKHSQPGVLIHRRGGVDSPP